MKAIVQYIGNFHHGYFSVKKYLRVLIFITALIGVNYYFDLENAFIDSVRPAVKRIPLFLGLNVVAYFGTLFIVSRFKSNSTHLNYKGLLFAFFGLLLLSVDRSVFSYLIDPLLGNVHQQEFLFYYKLLYNSYGWVTIFLALYFFKVFLDKGDNAGFYGLRLNGGNERLYLWILAAVIPISAIGATISEIGSFYPVYQRCGGFAFSALNNIPEWVSVVIYEFFYLTDFLNTELLFRGFLVIGVGKFLGKDTILPMVATYAVLHFGKPIGETISSVFGGYLLGIIAFYSRNIWGGVLIHTALAGCMELFAYLISS